jgi:histidinol-phosphatase
MNDDRMASDAPTGLPAPASDGQLRSWLDLALSIADEADAIALSHFRRDVEVRQKPDRSFVTIADTTIERLVRERIASVEPGHGFVGEEYGTEQAGATARWYIDPIDGTHNFIRGVPLFCLLLALEIGDELQVGVMSAPALRERWYALRGGGAWSIGAAGTEGPRRIRVSGVASVTDAQLLYGSLQDLQGSGRAPGFPALLREAWRERGFGDFWGYALVAEGAAEMMVEVDVSAWDLAAPMIVIEEAGGRLTDFEGRRRIDSRSALATNGIVHDEILARLQVAEGGDP